MILPICNPVQCREALEDLFNEYQVDLVLSGHVHSYRWVLAASTYPNLRTAA